MFITYYLAFAAGALSLLAPCVLPLIPIVFGSSLRASSWGPPLNALGLALSFTVFGVLTSLFAGLFDVDIIQKLGAFFLLFIGIIFLVPTAKIKLSQKMTWLSRQGGMLQGKVQGLGLASEFFVGLTLGMIWGPCSGPTLGFAFGLATQGESLIQSTLTFFSFGVGAGIGLILLGNLLSRFRFISTKLARSELYFNKGMGLLSVSLALLIIFNLLGVLEEWLLSISPAWLINLSSMI